MMKYTVTNTYGISGESTHRTPEAAIRERDTREGNGWIVVDENGDEWDDNGQRAVVVRHA